MLTPDNVALDIVLHVGGMLFTGRPHGKLGHIYYSARQISWDTSQGTHPHMKLTGMLVRKLELKP